MSTELTPRRATLYELASDLAAWQESLELCETDEHRLECEQRISECLDMTASKVDRFVWYLAHTESLIALAKAEEARLRERRKSLERFVESMKRGGLWVLQSLGMAKLQGEVSSIRTWGKADSVEIREGIMVPRRFQRGSVSCTLEQWDAIRDGVMDLAEVARLEWRQDSGDSGFAKKAILDEWKATGVCPPGCEIRQNQKTLRVE